MPSSHAARYEQLTSLLAKAIQQIATITGTFKDALVAWLGSAENGIGQFFADVGNFHKISVSDNTGTSCYTRSQLDAVVAAAGAATAPSGENAGAPAAPPASAARHA